MSTTSLIIEFFIIGLQALIWLLMLVLCFFDFNWVHFDFSKLLSPIVVIFLAPIVYPIGLFIDDVADLLSEYWKKKIKQNEEINNDSLNGFRLLFLSKDEWLRKYLDYIRIRIRLSRSTALNSLIIAFIFPAFTWVRLRDYVGESTIVIIFLEIIFFLFLTSLAALSWRSFTKNFYRRIKEGYEVYELSVNNTNNVT